MDIEKYDKRFSEMVRKAAYGFGDNKNKKRTLGIRDRQILYHRAKGICECCRKKIDFSEMQVGHKMRAYSKGGATTLANSICLCYKCNKLQGTESFETLRKKLTGTYGKKLKSIRKKNSNKRSGHPYSWEINFKNPF